jgi:hypothetical protein
MTDKVLCKDCKHSFIPFQSFLWHGFNTYAYKCRISFKETHEEFDPVTGPKKVKGEYQSCNIARVGSAVYGTERCGEEGKFWEPKNKKDLFKYIKHVSK